VAWKRFPEKSRSNGEKGIRRFVTNKDLTLCSLVTSWDILTIREPDMAYGSLFEGKKVALSPKNVYCWDK
jgi:hypothetical protein